MLFTSPTFLFIFSPLVVLVYLILPKLRNLFLLLASLFFYAWGETTLVFLLIAIILLNYLIAFKVKKSKFFLFAGISVNLLILFYFKYLVLFWTTAGKFIHIPLPAKDSIVLPLGISFITFHVISYLIDVYRQKIKPEKNLFDFALYISLFPHLIAGPIVRFADIGPQIKQRDFNWNNVNIGVQRFTIGLGKKILLANNLSPVSDRIFNLFPHELSPEVLWLGLIVFALQIFFDFSGYSDMAIGLARIFGFEFAENFNYPYLATSVQDFWRRWHMTLSSWFRDYVYIPLGGNRGGPRRTIVNILIVFGLTGFWHGASFSFLFWGLYFGLFLSLERLFLGNILNLLWLPFRILYTLLVVIIGWLFFRVENLQYAFFLFKLLFGMGGTARPVYDLSFFLTPQLLIVLFSSIIIAGGLIEKISQLKFGFRWSYLFLTGALLLSLMQLAAQTYQPFIYFKF